jgi:acyl-CoA hydrolase
MKNQKMHAINSAIEIDLQDRFVQILSELISTAVLVDKWILCVVLHLVKVENLLWRLPHVPKGIPRIVPFLKEGAGVVTTRGHIHYVVTEYGTAYLYGKNLRQRAKALIDISHPDDREMLERAALKDLKTNNC